MLVVFDDQVARQYGYDFISEDHLRRAQRNAAIALERDPYNPDLLKIMKKFVHRHSLTEDGRLMAKVVEHRLGKMSLTISAAH